MAQSENNANGRANGIVAGNGFSALNNNGTARLPFEMPLSRARGQFLQQNFGKRLTTGPDYETPPSRSVRITFKYSLKLTYSYTN